jgi:hypothetical protein
MTDISALFAQDDAVFDMPVMGRDPETGSEVDTGVVFQIRSIKNPDSVAVVKKRRNAVMGARLSNGGTASPEELGEVAFMDMGMDPSDEQLAHCVTGWDWNGKSLGKYKTEYSFANVLAIIKGVPWIRAQVHAKAVQITDFTKA